MIPIELPPPKTEHAIISYDLVRNYALAAHTTQKHTVSILSVAANEADLALGRVTNSNYWKRLTASSVHAHRAYLDPSEDMESLRHYFAHEDVDFDALLGAASRHFESPQIIRRTEPLTVAELEGLIEDDERAISG